MRVGILSYPMLFQRDGGLQVQIRETIAALNAPSPAGDSIGEPIQAELADPNRERLDTYDVVHVFSAINGNHRIVETAVDMGVPVVLSPLLSPGWDRQSGFRARIADRLAGRLTAWNMQTSYAQTKRALQLAQLVVALGQEERQAIESGFLVDRQKIRVLPNGISPHFFSADETLFRQRYNMARPFVLMVGAISPYKNQLGLVNSLAASGLPIVMIGHAQRQHQTYLQQILASPQVQWLGQLDHDDPLLASAYRAAAVLALPSQGEVFPLVVLEALAAGTPVVMTDESALHLPDSAFALRQLRWNDGGAQSKAIRDFVEAPPPRAQVQALVARFTWQRVAAETARYYRELLREHKGVRCAV